MFRRAVLSFDEKDLLIMEIEDTMIAKDKAPEPPNMSKALRPSKPPSRKVSQLNSVSRWRSPVGLRPSAFKTGIFVRFQHPPMILTLPLLLAGIAKLSC